MNTGTIAALLLGLFLLAAAGCEEPPSAEDVLEFKKGRDAFIEDIRALDSPKGIVPEIYDTQQGGLFVISDENYHEHFVYDANCALVVISRNPLCYAKLNTGEFYRQLDFERDQILSGKTAAQKKPASVPWFRTCGPVSLCICFIPNELRYATEGKLSDINHATYDDPFLLVERAQKILFYTPQFEEERMYKQMKNKLQNGATVVQYTKKAAFDSPINRKITWYQNEQMQSGFSVIAAQKLEPAQEENTSSEDFMLITASPLGNSQRGDKSYLSADAAGRHGIALMVRGNLAYCLRFLEGEGISFETKRKLPLSLVISDSFAGSVSIDWEEKQKLTLVTGYEGFPDTEMTHELEGSGFVMSDVKRGETLYARVYSFPDKTLLASSSLFLSELVITEIAYWGTSVYCDSGGANEDDYIEIRNISGADVDLSAIDIICTNTNLREKLWCGPSYVSWEGSSSPAYAPIDRSLAPGESLVIYTRVNLNPSRFFHACNYGPPQNGIERGSVSNIAVAKGYTIGLSRSGKVFHTVSIDGSIGTKSPYRSMVRSQTGSFVTSENDSGVPINASIKKKNYCSPGYSAAGEL